MPGLNFVLSAGLILEDLQFRAAKMPENFSGDRSFGDVLPAEHLLIVIADGENAIERHFAADLALEALDPDRLAGLDAILLSTTANYGVHTASPHNGQKPIIDAQTI